MGNLSKIESGDRKPPEQPGLWRIATALELVPDSDEWRELFKAAARDRFESIDEGGITYLGYENSLRGLPKQSDLKTVSLAEAVLQIGKVAAARNITKITVITEDGEERDYYISEKN